MCHYGYRCKVSYIDMHCCNPNEDRLCQTLSDHDLWSIKSIIVHQRMLWGITAHTSELKSNHLHNQHHEWPFLDMLRTFRVIKAINSDLRSSKILRLWARNTMHDLRALTSQKTSSSHHYVSNSVSWQTLEHANWLRWHIAGSWISKHDTCNMRARYRWTQFTEA